MPVINENDTVATSEIRFGDNDRLAARVAEMVQADTLVLLSDIDGLYTADPRRIPTPRTSPWSTAMTPEIEAMAGEPPPGYTSGGMRTKLVAARDRHPGRLRHGDRASAMWNGRCGRWSRGRRCTWFLPAPTAARARKRWIAGSLSRAGVLTVDAGRRRGAGRGSLLPAGVVAVDGGFQRGDPFCRRERDGRELARGLFAYWAADARRIMGHRSRNPPRSWVIAAGREK